MQRIKMHVAAVAAFGVVASVAGVMLARQPSWQSADGGVSVAAPARLAAPVVAAPAAPAPKAPARRVYPYSIVPGGVHDRAELLQAIRTDRLVAAHYAGFQADKAVVVKVRESRAVYVSYRKNGKVYWTSKPVMLAQGETLLSDGTSEIRTRCGNRISEVAQMPVAAGEPSEEVLDTAMDAQDEGSVEPTAFDMDVGGAGASPSAVTFATGAGLVMADNRGAPGYGMPGMGGLSAPGHGPDGGNVLPPVTLTPPAQAIQAAAPRTQVTRANPGSRVGGAAGSSTGADPGTTPGATLPIEQPPPHNDSPAPVTHPELPPLPNGPAPSPEPLAPTAPGVKDGSVPEPGSLWLAGIALAALLVLHRRRRRGKVQ